MTTLVQAAPWIDQFLGQAPSGRRRPGDDGIDRVTRIAVTGAGGFVGRHTARALLPMGVMSSSSLVTPIRLDSGR